MIFEKIREKLFYAVQEAKVLQETTDSYGYMMVKKGLNHATDIVNEVEAEYNNGWISVESELPEPYKSVLVLEENGEIHLCRYYDNCKRFYYDGSDWDIKLGCVTHWQPLPQPPKGE